MWIIQTQFAKSLVYWDASMGRWSSEDKTKYKTQAEAQTAADRELPKGHNATIKEIR